MITNIISNISILLVFFLSFLLYIVGINLLFRILHAYKYYITAEAEIIGFHKFKKGYPIIKFQVSDKKTVQVKTYFSAPDLKTVGKKVFILYNPKNHKDIIFKTPSSLFLAFGLIVLSAPFFITISFAIIKQLFN